MEIVAAPINDAAKALGIGRTSVYGLIREGKLEVRKIGRRTVIPLRSLQNFLRTDHPAPPGG